MATATTYEFRERLFCIQALQISKDFRLSMCLDSCVKVLSLNQEASNPEIRTLLRQSIIPAEKDVLDIPRYNLDQHRDLQAQISRADVNNLCTDKVMNPFKYTQDMLSTTGFCATSWSPQGADELGRCILATLSLDYRMLLFSQRETESKWYKIADMTEIRHKATRPSANYKKPELFHAYREWCYGQAVTAISWCPNTFTDLADGSNYSILAAGTYSGHVVFWKVKMPCLSESDCTVLSTNRDHSNKVMCMAWSESSGILAVSHYRGSLTIGLVNKDFGTIKWTVLDTSEDLMKVSCMCFCRTDKDEEEIVIVNKEEYIYGFHLRQEEDSNITILSEGFAYGLRQKYATGICNISDKSCLISSLGGTMELVKLEVKDTGLHLEVSNFNDLPTSEKEIRLNGLAVSPNKAFFAYIQRPPTAYDHLSTEWKRPTKLVMKTLDHKSKEDISNLLINHTGSLDEVRDFVECYRQAIISNPNQYNRKKGTLSKRELQLERFTLFSMIAQIKKKITIKMGFEVVISDKLKAVQHDIEQVSYQVLGVHIEQCVKSIMDQKQIQQQDLRLLCQFLLFIDKSASALREVMDVDRLQSSIKGAITDSNESIQHSCPVCTTDMTIEQLSWQCPNGHKFEVFSSLVSYTYNFTKEDPYRQFKTFLWRRSCL